MELRCPKCCSRDIAPHPRGIVYQCERCEARFHRSSALITVAAAESGAHVDPATRQRFSLDRKRAAEELTKADGAITVVNPYSDAYELTREVPLVNGEYAWIGLTLADLD